MSHKQLSLPPGCILRSGTPGDMWTIRLLVLGAKLDPTQLRAAQFWVIECDNQIVACGQLRNFSDAQELGSLVVKPDWRGHGLGTFLTQHLISQATQPLYLECLGERLVRFYSRFGFESVAFEEIAPSLQPKFGLSNLGKKLLGMPVVFMKIKKEERR